MFANTALPVEGFLPNPKARLKDQFHEVARFKHLSPLTEEAYWDWVIRFLKFQRKGGQWRHPRELSPVEISAFLSHLATVRNVAASTQNQALNALVFLYREVLHLHVEGIRDITHLHHALDACVLGIAANLFKNQKLGASSLWELLIKRKYNEQEKTILGALGIFQFDKEGNSQLKNLSNTLKEEIRQRLAEKRVVQHIPARMDGMPVDQNMWRLRGWKPDGKRPA